MKKVLIIAMAAILLVGAAVGGTYAWLMDKTAPITNTFTVGNVSITLTETERTYKMVPGNTLDKDPTLTVLKGSEACWVFVKIEESDNLKNYITYELATGWTALDGVAGVYYCEQAALTDENAEDAVYSILKDDQVTVKSEITKVQMEAAATDKPTLTFTGYAIQKDGFTTAAAAWTEVSN